MALRVGDVAVVLPVWVPVPAGRLAALAEVGLLVDVEAVQPGCQSANVEANLAPLFTRHLLEADDAFARVAGVIAAIARLASRTDRAGRVQNLLCHRGGGGGGGVVGGGRGGNERVRLPKKEENNFVVVL